MIFCPRLIPVRYALLNGPFVGQSVPMGVSELAVIEIENGDRWERYCLAPGLAAYRWEPE